MTKFCHICGASIANESALFCDKCGAKMPLIQPGYVVAPEKTKGSTINSVIKWGAICTGGLILLSVVSALIFGFTGNVPSSSIQPPSVTLSPTLDVNNIGKTTVKPTVIAEISDSSNTIITKSFSEIALTINDLPNGWMANGAPTVTENEYHSSFVNINTGSNAVTLTFSTTKYPTVDEAKTAYANQKSQVTDVKVNSINAGNEGFAYQDIVDTHAIFRKGNLIISISTTHYPSVPVSYLTPYAQLVSNRI